MIKFYAAEVILLNKRVLKIETAAEVFQSAEMQNLFLKIAL